MVSGNIPKLYDVHPIRSYAKHVVRNLLWFQFENTQMQDEVIENFSNAKLFMNTLRIWYATDSPLPIRVECNFLFCWKNDDILKLAKIRSARWQKSKYSCNWWLCSNTCQCIRLRTWCQIHSSVGGAFGRPNIDESDVWLQDIYAREAKESSVEFSRSVKRKRNTSRRCAKERKNYVQLHTDVSHENLLQLTRLCHTCLMHLANTHTGQCRVDRTLQWNHLI